MTDAALLGVVDAVAWERSVLAGVEPVVDLGAAWAVISRSDFDAVMVDPRVSGSKILQHLVDIENLRRAGKIVAWKLVAVEAGGVVRVDLQPGARSVDGSRTWSGKKMVVLRAA